jgi:hypothetical protein
VPGWQSGEKRKGTNPFTSFLQELCALFPRQFRLTVPLPPEAQNINAILVLPYKAFPSPVLSSNTIFNFFQAI